MKAVNASKRGFSLMEMAIVLSTIGIIIGGVWVAAAGARQSARVRQAADSVASAVTQVRAAYAARASITGGIGAVMQNLANINAQPAPTMRTYATTCNGVTSFYAETPWGSGNNSNNSAACGSFRVCAWNYGGDAICNGGASSQYFAVELVGLDYGSCLTLVAAVQPKNPSGLIDVYINGASSVATGLPVSPTTASANCAQTLTNAVDFIYTLRAPLS